MCPYAEQVLHSFKGSVSQYFYLLPRNSMKRPNTNKVSVCLFPPSIPCVALSPKPIYFYFLL